MFQFGFGGAIDPYDHMIKYPNYIGQLSQMNCSYNLCKLNDLM